MDKCSLTCIQRRVSLLLLKVIYFLVSILLFISKTVSFYYFMLTTLKVKDFMRNKNKYMHIIHIIYIFYYTHLFVVNSVTSGRNAVLIYYECFY